MRSERWLVVGGGFQGIIGAYLLASQGHDVTLVERTTQLGGVLASQPWQGFYLDKGCHLFDNDDDLTTSLVLDILDDEVEPVNVRYASVLQGQKVDGIALPDLAAHGQEAVQSMLYELLQAVTRSHPAPRDLAEHLTFRFGPTAARHLVAAAAKIYQIEARELAPEALALSPFGRIKFLEPAMAELLKQQPVFDERIATPSQEDPMRYYRDRTKRFPHRNFYPTERGLLKFCEKAEARLRALGVTMRLGVDLERVRVASHDVQLDLVDGTTLTGDRIFWAAGAEVFAKLGGLESQIAPLVHRVPMVLCYFVLPREEVSDLTYVHDFDAADHVFRASIPGNYVSAAPCPPGLTYVCAEIPTRMGSAIWENPQAHAGEVWEEVRRLGLVTGRVPRETLCVKTPVSFKLPKVGYQDAVERLAALVPHRERFIGLEHWDFTKNNIIRSLQATLLQVGA